MSIVYQANITANIPGYTEKIYLAVSETIFKVRYGNHKKSFTKQHQKNHTKLSKGYWKVKKTKRNSQNKVESIKEMPHL